MVKFREFGRPVIYKKLALHVGRGYRVLCFRACTNNCRWQKELLSSSLAFIQICAFSLLNYSLFSFFLEHPLCGSATSRVLALEVEKQSSGNTAEFTVVTHHVATMQDFPYVPISLELTDGHVLLLVYPPSQKQLEKREDEML